MKRLATTLFLAVTLLAGSPVNAINKTAEVPPHEVTTPKSTSTTIRAWVTSYSSIDSCHYPGCVMASGKKAYIGAVACPRHYRLGRVVKILGRRYTCEDRTARRFDGRFDLFAGYLEQAHQKALRFGKRFLEVRVGL